MNYHSCERAFAIRWSPQNAISQFVQQTLFAQGPIAAPLWSIIRDGNIDELWRFHVWFRDGWRGKSEYAFQSHWPYSQSWILAGQGADHCHDIEQVQDLASVTDAEYALNWNDAKSLSTTYKTHQKYLMVSNTGQLVKATPTTFETHGRNMTYVIKHALFHRSEVAPDMLHAIIIFFFFDSARGFFKDAGVLGPRGRGFHLAWDDVEGAILTLVTLVEAVREWKMTIEDAKCTQKAVKCSKCWVHMQEV